MTRHSFFGWGEPFEKGYPPNPLPKLFNRCAGEYSSQKVFGWITPALLMRRHIRTEANIFGPIIEPGQILAGQRRDSHVRTPVPVPVMVSKLKRAFEIGVFTASCML